MMFLEPSPKFSLSLPYMGGWEVVAFYFVYNPALIKGGVFVFGVDKAFTYGVKRLQMDADASLADVSGDGLGDMTHIREGDAASVLVGWLRAAADSRWVAWCSGGVPG